jgi:hypothetical protein
MRRSTRRNALQRGLLFVGGLVGLGAAARTTSLPTRGSSLVLYARDLDAYAGGRRASGMPARGEQTTSRARLFDGPSGHSVGELHVASVALRGPGAGSADAGAMEWHTFHLPGGTIIGSGTAGSERGEFAILGGTGRYANARGIYTLRRGELGESDAEFVLRFEP